MKPLVTCVMPFRNAAATLPVQLAALAAQTYPGPLEFVFADNGSIDGGRGVLEEWLPRLGGPARVAKATAGRGPAYARNAAGRHARGEWLAFCDADDRVPPDWIERLLGTALASGGDLVAGVARDWEGSEAATTSDAPLWRPAAKRHLGVLPALAGCNVLIRAPVLSALGGWEEALRTGEDADLAWRAQAAGYRLVEAADAIIDHRMRVAPADAFRQHFRYGLDDVRLLARHPGLPRQRVSGARRRKLREALRRSGRWLAGAGRGSEARATAAFFGLELGHLAGLFRYGLAPF